MKILQLTSHLNVGGIPRYVLSLAEQLSQRGHQVIIASDGGVLEPRVAASGAAHWKLPLKTSQEVSLRVFKSIRQLENLLKQEPVDIIHAHTRVAQVVAEQVSQRTKIPYVTTWHGIYKRRVGRRLYTCAGEACIAISAIVREHLLTDFGVSPDRVQLIYNGIDVAHFSSPPPAAPVEEYRRKLGIPPGHPVIGGIGRLAAGEVKGFDLLLGAACLAKEHIPNLHVLIVGDGPRRPFLEDVAERLDLLGSVHFLGGVEDVRIPLAMMDVFMFPSRWPEAFGLTLIEAMAAGKPVVATRMGAVPEIVRDGIDGFVTPPEDIETLAAKITELFNDRALARRLGQQAQRHADEQFNVRRMALQIEQLYQKTLSGEKVRS